MDAGLSIRTCSKISP